MGTWTGNSIAGHIHKGLGLKAVSDNSLHDFKGIGHRIMQLFYLSPYAASAAFERFEEYSTYN
jgi:hypothetical protein